jgi:hypothetical protein
MASLKSNTYELREQLYDRQGKSRLQSANWKNPVNAIGTTVTGVFSDLSQSFVEKTGGLTSGDINKVWRLKILTDKLGGPATGRIMGLPRDSASTGKGNIPNKLPNQKVCQAGGYPIPKMNEASKKVWKADLNEGLMRPVGNVDGDHYESLPVDQPDTKTFKVSRTSKDRKDVSQQASNHRRNEIIIFNMNSTDNGYQYITLQNRPPELEFQGETAWATIKSFGRNVPMYHFTGAEDKIQLQISWFCNDPERPWEVIQKCRLLEAWSKADGYYAGPPILQIDWGGSGLFSNALFILTSANYILKNFRDGYIDRRLEKPEWVDGKLYPMAATQELVFNRVSGTNPLHSSIYDPSKLEGLSGVGYLSTAPNDIKQTNVQDENSLWQSES